MGARALIVTGLDHEPELTGLAKRFGAPVVATSIYEASASLPTIGYDNFELGRQAMRHLLDLGPGMSPWFPGPRRRTTEPVSGFVARIHRGRGFAANDRDGAERQGGAVAAKQALAWDRRPTALLCVTDLIALGAMFELQRSGLLLPRDMSVMGFDHISWSEHSHPRLTCISLPVAAMGHESAQAICDFLKDGTPIPSVLLQGEFKVRAPHADRRTRLESRTGRGDPRKPASSFPIRPDRPVRI